MIDVTDIKEDVRNYELRFWVSDKYIFCGNKRGEKVIVGEVGEIKQNIGLIIEQ